MTVGHDEKVASESLLESHQAALNAIKVIHKADGRSLSKDEVLDFINRPVWMGRPVYLRGKRGPVSKRTQYDAAFERRHSLYHRLVALPKSGALARSGQVGSRTRIDVARVTLAD